MKAKQIRHIFLLTILSAMLTTVFSACNHKDLCYDHTHRAKLKVVYDWSEAPDATPRGMCVFFYSLDNPTVYYRFDFDNTEGGDVELPAGRYRLITYNNDTEIVKFSGTNIFEAHKAYTRTGDILEPLYGNGVTSNVKPDNGEAVMITPDGLWGCHSDEIEVIEQGESHTIIHNYTPEGIASAADSDDEEVQIITLYPHDMLCHYSFEVRNVDNIDHISRISATLSGMSGAMTVGDEHLDSQKVTLPLSAHIEALSGTKAASATKEVVGQFLTFGHDETSPAPHKMTFYVVMDDGSKYEIKDAANLDVTTQVDNAPDQRHVHIIIDNLKLPTPGTPDDGFVPTIDDWGVKQEDIKV